MEALTQMIMRVWTPHHPPLLPCSHCMLRQPLIAYHYEQQEQWCYTCDQTGHFSWDCPVCLKALKDKKGLNLKGEDGSPQSNPTGPQKALLPQSKMRSITHMA